MKLDQSRMERALEYLSSTDEPAAELRANVERAEYKAKAIRDKVFLLEVGSVAETKRQRWCAYDVCSSHQRLLYCIAGK